jgi:hypothetical protein
MRIFIIIIFVLHSMAVLSQRPLYDTTGKNLQQQMEVMSRQVDSLRAVATAKSDLLNKISEHYQDVLVLLYKARENTIFDHKQFIDSLVPRMVSIYTGSSDFVFRTILQFNAIQATMQKALTVYKPAQQKLIDTLSAQYMSIDKQRQEVHQEFDNLLILLDESIGVLEDLKKKRSEKQKQ